MEEKQKQEQQISTNDLAKEIFFAVNDYFLAGVSCSDNRINIDFLNGQKFVLTITEK